MADHYYSERPGSRLKYSDIRYQYKGRELMLRTGSGVFSIGRVDKGTETLLRYMQVSDAEDILDLGCGYGIVGIAAAISNPSSRVLMSDVNRRAVKLSKENIRLNRIENAEAVNGHGFEKIDKKFDAILLNPPQSAGKDLCFSLITDAEDHLKEDGSMQVVARKNKGGTALSEHMKKVFGNVSVLGKKSGFWVYKSKKTHDIQDDKT